MEPTNYPDVPQPKTAVTSPPNQPETPLPRRGFVLKNTKVLAAAAAGLSLVCLGAGCYWFYSQRLAASPTTQPSAPLPTPPTWPPHGEVTWLDSPQEVASLPVFQPHPLGREEFSILVTDQAKFYKVATFEDGSSLINCWVPIQGPGTGEEIIRFIQGTDGSYTCLANYLDSWLVEELRAVLTFQVEMGTLLYLETPDTIRAGDKIIKKTGVISEKQFSDLESPQFVLDTVYYGSLYKTEVNILESSEIWARHLYLKLKDSSVIRYALETGVLTDDDQAVLTLDNGERQADCYSQSQVTGSAELLLSTPVIKSESPLLQNMTKIANLPNGDSVYQVLDANSDLVKALYEVYRGSRDYPEAPPVMSREDFAATIGAFFLWKDALGDYQIFINQEFVPLAELGKPVIYLYPQQETSVKVRVGANISLSDPLYPPGGWSVAAHPNGTLTYQGRLYDSLFWEGQGHGYYPDYRDQGVVVSQAELLPTLQKQLSQLGLTPKEAADFLTFWVPRLPNTPYVRLTWLGTWEMNRLAPLEVEPQPDTIIRIFLEFEGLQEIKALKPQALASPARRGFTLIEWGGLLIKPH